MEGSPDAAPRMATAVGCLTQAALAAPAVAADAMPHAPAASAAHRKHAASAAVRLHAAPAISVSAAAATVACAPGTVRQQMMILKPKMM